MATLKVNITESINLNNSNYGASNTVSISGINEVDKRVVTVLTSTNGTQVYAGGSAAAQGTFITSSVKYIRITNTDTANFVTLSMEDGTARAQFRLEAGKSFIIGNPDHFDNNADIDTAVDNDITKIEAKADTAAVKLEVYVATS